MSIDQQAYCAAYEKLRRFMLEEPSPSYREFVTAYEAAKDQPGARGAENGTVAQEIGVSRTETGQPVDCREAFERWWNEQPSENIHINSSIGAVAWDAWQAAWKPKRESR